MQIESDLSRSGSLAEKEIVTRQSFSESNTEPVITVIIPAYNASDHLAKCVNSLKKQQFRDFEIIAVNDGSTDNTQQVLEYQLQLLDRPYTIVTRKNGGVSAARNSGIEHARGKYLFFIDADDYLSPHCLLKLYNKMVEGSSDIVFCGFVRVDKAGRLIKGYRDSYSYLETVVESQRAIISFLRKEIWISVGCALYRKETVDKYRLKFLEGCNYGEDQDFIIRYLSNSQCVSSVPEELMYYVSHPASATNQSTMGRFLGVDMWRDLGDYLK